jgi:hypothetical protein
MGAVHLSLFFVQRDVIDEHVAEAARLGVHGALLDDLDFHCTVSCVALATLCASAMTADSNAGL